MTSFSMEEFELSLSNNALCIVSADDFSILKMNSIFQSQFEDIIDHDIFNLVPKPLIEKAKKSLNKRGRF